LLGSSLQNSDNQKERRTRNGGWHQTAVYFNVQSNLPISSVGYCRCGAYAQLGDGLCVNCWDRTWDQSRKAYRKWRQEQRKFKSTRLALTG
jgi:hypothetical protein